MIVKKSWFTYTLNYTTVKYKYTGYFLFGFIPLYVIRNTYHWGI